MDPPVAPARVLSRKPQNQLPDSATGCRPVRIDYIPAHVLQASPEVYVPRKPLSDTARRANWQGFKYDLNRLPPIGIVRVFPEEAS